MKKFTAITLACMSIMLFASCSSTKFDYDYEESMGTPENSVIMYGGIEGGGRQSFSQMDPKFDPDYQELTRDLFYSAPVQPGSTYALAYSGGGFAGSYTWHQYFPMNIQSLYIRIPKEPGLFYIGLYDGIIVNRYAKLNKMHPKYENTIRLKILNKMLKQYEGTVWEPEILAEIEKVNGEE